MNRKFFSERIPDLIAILLLITIYIKFLDSEYFYGGDIAKITSTFLLICSFFISWYHFKNKHWSIKILGGYIGTLLLLNLFQILLLDIITGSISWFINLFILIAYSSLWYYFIVVKSKIKILPNIFKDSSISVNKEKQTGSKIGDYSLIIGLSVILIFTFLMIIGIYFSYNDQIQNYKIWKDNLTISIFVLFIFSIIGLVFGILGLKKIKKTSAKIGLVLNSIYSIPIFLLIIVALIKLI